MNQEQIRYFEEKFIEHGATPKGLDYSGLEAQTKRFEQFERLFKTQEKRFTINDFGCGYGALSAYLSNKEYSFDYFGYDPALKIIEWAKQAYNQKNHFFYCNKNDLPTSDFTIACGIFNVKLNSSDDDWRNFIFETIDFLNLKSKKGFGFNCLTKYSDPDRMRGDLFYSDPLELFDYCKKRFSRNVCLLHDYDLYDFTILVRL